MKRICYISDTHGLHKQLIIPENVDILIHSGDVSMRGSEKEIIDFLIWFDKLPVKNKIFIAGNHDWFFEKTSKYIINDLLSYYPTVTYLNDYGCEVDGIKIWGSPISPWFHSWAFNRYRGDDIKKHWDMIHEETDILITHGPPLGYGDYVIRDGVNVGCEDLKNVIWKNSNIKINCFGHIHQGYGIYKDGDKTFINASVLNEDYHLVNEPIIIEYDKLT